MSSPKRKVLRSFSSQSLALWDMPGRALGQRPDLGGDCTCQSPLGKPADSLTNSRIRADFGGGKDTIRACHAAKRHVMRHTELTHQLRMSHHANQTS